MPELDIPALLRELVGAELPDPLDPVELEAGGNWVLSTRLGRLDIMQYIGDQALWDALRANTIVDQVAGFPLRIVGYEDLVGLKERAGRPEDLTDLQRLHEARQG